MISSNARHAIQYTLFAVLAWANVPTPAYADTAPKWTDAQLAGFADYIVRGRVTRVAVGRDDRIGSPYTYVSLDVFEVVKGALTDRQITLKQLGGRIGTTALQIAGQPGFDVGEEVLVFLEVRPRDGTLATTAMWQGKFTIVASPTGDQAIRQDPSGAARGIFGDQSRGLADWLASLRRLARDGSVAGAHTAVTAPAGAALATGDSSQGVMGAPTWRGATTVRVDAASPGQPQLPDGGERELAQAADAWTATGVTALATGGLQPPGCFFAHEPDGRIAVGVDGCQELSPTGGTLALSGAWVEAGGGDTGLAAPRFIGGGAITNGSQTAAHWLGTSACFTTLATHELGHVLGLTHTAEGSGPMAPYLACAGPLGTIAPTSAASRSSSITSSIVAPGARPMLVPLGPTVAAAAAVSGTERISVATDGTQANGASFLPALSADGRYVAFQSDATNLVAGDTNAATDIFVRDRVTGVTTRASVATNGTQANGASSQPAISADGRYVAFYSLATNLVAGATAGQIYVRDRVQGITIVASVSTAGAPSNDLTYRPAISGNGLLAGFDAAGTNLASNDTNGCLDVFTHDITPGPTTRESVSSAGVQATCTNGGIGSYQAALSTDGRYVAFASTAPNLATLSGTLPSCNVAVCSNVYVHDRQTGATTLESIASDGSVLNGYSPSISGDGRYLVFRRDSPSSANSEIYLRDRTSGQTTGLVSAFILGGQQISADGRYVSYVSGSNLIVYDRQTGVSTAVADALNNSAVGGGIVAFSSSAALVVNDTNQLYDIFAVSLSGVPSSPTGLAATLSGSTLTLTWTAPSSGSAATAYIIEAGTTPGATDVANFSTGSTATSFSASVGGNSSFYIRVRASNSLGTSAPSNEITVVVGNPTLPPGAPTALTASASGTNITLTWTAPTTGAAATSYIVEAGSASGTANLANFNTGTTATTFSAAGVGPGTYFIRVRSVNGAGVSGPSNEAVLIVLSGCAAPGAPADLAAAVSGSSVTLTWTAGANVASYQLQAGSAPGRTDLADSSTGSSATLYTAQNVGAGSYFVRVRSNNGCGQSAASNEVLIIVR